MKYSFFFSLIFSVLSTMGQTTITGKVIDANNREPLDGATVTVVGTSISVNTNNQGVYSMQLQELSSNTALLVKFVGYQTRIVNTEAKEDMTIELNGEETKLDEVVVTALGIKREEKSLGYATSTVKGEELTEALSSNWTEALSGKVAGLNLVRSGAGPASSNKIILRGENNLTEDNQALIVIDGVVINNSSGASTGSGNAAYLGEDSPVDFGNALNDINPDDIESVSVLKGPGAAALYGQRGANGAIIITTKSGNEDGTKRMKVRFDSNASFESISRWPQYQYEYGSGKEGVEYFSWGNTEDGASTRSSSVAWGPRFEKQMFYQYDPVTHTGSTDRTLWQGYPNNRKDFFETGKVFKNTLSLDGGTNNTSFRLSYTNVQNQWIIPNTGYTRNTLALSINQKVSDKLRIAAKVNYTNKSSDNLPAVGYNNQTIMYWNIMQVPNGNLDWLRDYWMPDKEGVSQSYPFSTSPDNPYLIVNEMLNKLDRNTITGNVQLNYEFNKHLDLMLRTSLDMSNESRSEQRPMDTQKFKYGMFRTMDISPQEQAFDFLLKYNKEISNKLETTFSFGGSKLHNKYKRSQLRANSLLFPQDFSLANSKDALIALPYQSEYNINSLYGIATFAYNNNLFLDITGRNDWNSVLATPTSVHNVSFFYPSINLSVLLSDLIEIPTYVSFAKVRASYSEVGSGGTRTYLNTYVYNSLSEYSGGLRNPTVLPNENLKPQRTRTFEIGTDLRFLENRLGVDIALYQGETKDQILTATLDRTSGYNSMVVNGGLIRNRGIEIETNATLIKRKKGLNWKVFGTFSANENTVLELTDDLFALQLQNTLSGRGSIEARVGSSMNSIYGPGYQRRSDGQIIYGEDGYPLLTDDVIYLGNTSPKWKMSLGNEFVLGNFRLKMLVDGQYGGVGYSLTHALLAEHGKLESTLPGRYNGIIGKGVIANEDGTYRTNDVVADDIWTYYTRHYGRENLEGSTFNTDFIKLREVSLFYTLPKSFCNKIGVGKSRIGIYGRDLFMITSWPAFDPEFGTLNNGSIDKGFEVAQFPATRTFGINLNVEF